MWADHNSLCVRSVERRVSSIEKLYFQLKVCLTEVFIPPAEFESDDIWVEAKGREYIINVFERSSSTNAVLWYYLNMDADDPKTGAPGMPRIICGCNVGQMQAAYFVSETIELFSACESDLVQPDYLLSGITIRLYVEPYKIDSITVNRFTMPVLWDEAYPTHERKLALIKAAFAKENKTISSQQKVCKLNRYRSSENGSINRRKYDEFDGPSDGYGGHLNDDFINDGLGGEADAYWNLD